MVNGGRFIFENLLHFLKVSDGLWHGSSQNGATAPPQEGKTPAFLAPIAAADAPSQAGVVLVSGAPFLLPGPLVAPRLRPRCRG